LRNTLKHRHFEIVLLASSVGSSDEVCTACLSAAWSWKPTSNHRRFRRPSEV